jgi:hypothetical protein
MFYCNTDWAMPTAIGNTEQEAAAEWERIVKEEKARMK